MVHKRLNIARQHPLKTITNDVDVDEITKLLDRDIRSVISFEKDDSYGNVYWFEIDNIFKDLQELANR